MLPLKDLTEPFAGQLWRVIEGQYQSATIKLVDNHEEHDILEAELEAAKPKVPQECEHLNYQFWSPFRYGCYPNDSRFRRRGKTLGVWYGSLAPFTAICEFAWGMLTFLRNSPETPFPKRPIEYTALAASIGTLLSVDLTRNEFASQGNWTDPNDYSDCLNFSDHARREKTELIFYSSVRDPEHRLNGAVLTCSAFSDANPVDQQTWHIRYTPKNLLIACETTRQRITLVPQETKFAIS